jgi:hypothetical protein
LNILINLVLDVSIPAAIATTVRQKAFDPQQPQPPLTAFAVPNWNNRYAVMFAMPPKEQLL